MAKEPEKKLPEKAGEETKKKGFNIKILLIGLPIFIIQLVAVYFITANILISKLQPASNNNEEQTAVVIIVFIVVPKCIY